MTEHARPDLSMAPRPPDLLVRLDLELSRRGVFDLPIDVLSGEMARQCQEAIAYLRAANQRHVDDERHLNESRTRCADLEAEVAISRRRIASLERDLAAARAQEGR